MHKISEEKLESLVESLIAFDARQILIDTNRYKPAGRFTERARNIHDIYNEIKQLFEEDKEVPNPELLNKLAIKYLKHQRRKENDSKL